jgi:hypothetical protein
VRPLPVIATIREAYDFTFANLGAIIGLIWLPMVLVSVGEFFLVQHFSAAVQDALAAGNPNAAGPAALALFLFALAALGFYAMMLTSVTQLALGQRQAGGLFHFSFGALEWRVFRNLFGLVLFLLPGYLLLMIGMSRVAVAATAVDGIALLTVAVIVGGLAFFGVRLAGVLLPVVLHEEKQALIKSWSLTAGNFWRLLGVFAGVIIPIYFAMMLVVAAVVGDSVPQGTMPTAEQVIAARNANLPLLSGLSFFIAPLMIGLVVGTSVISWRKLTAKTDIIA